VRSIMALGDRRALLERVVALSLTWGQAPVKSFLAACIAAIVLAAIGWIVLNRMQEPADRAFATPPYTRVGD
jgi:hypothetical protein